MSRLEKLKMMRAAVNWNIVEERRDLLLRLYYLTSDWKVQLPNLLDVFRAEEIEWLLAEATKSTKDHLQSQRFIEFVARTGFKDEPKLDEVGKPISRRVTAVHIAAAYGLNVIRDLFKIYHRFDVNFISEHGVTHFHLACEFGLEDVAKKFLDLGADPNLLVKNTGDSPLHFAVANNFNDTKKVVELLLRRGANPNIANAIGLTPLHIISKKYDSQELAELFFKICDDLGQTVWVDAQDNEGNTPLHEAFIHRNRQLVELLVKRGADLNVANNDGFTPLHHISDLLDNESLTTIFEIWDKRQQTAQIDAQDKFGNAPLHLALKFKNNKLVELLLSRGADPNIANSDGTTPLHLISEYDDDEKDDNDLMEMLFEIWDERRKTMAQIDTQDKSGNTPLHLAMKCHNKTLVDLLLERGADQSITNYDGTTPLHLVSDYDDVVHDDCFREVFFEFWDILGKTTAEIDTQDKSGNTPLHLALKFKNNKLVELLLSRGADPNIANSDGTTPLHLISEYDDEDDYDDLVEMFFEIWDERRQTTAQVDVQDKGGNAPLHNAANCGNKKVVEKLLRRGANANLATNFGTTPLHIICCNIEGEDDGLTKLFFDICDERQLKVQVDAADEFGNTPLHLIFCNHERFPVDPRLIELVLRRGADLSSVNQGGRTPLHMICKRASSRDELLVMYPRLAQLDVVDKLGRTPLRWAVENLVPRVVDILLDHGADLSSFVFPTASDFAERLDTRVFSSIYANFKLIMASSLLAIAENLEQRGYVFNRSDALTIMKFFAERDLFEKPSNLDKCWYDDEEFTSKAKEIMIRVNDPSLSLYEWSKLTPAEEEKLLKYEDYFKFAKFDHLSIFPEGVKEACQLRLCEMMSRGFFRRWTLDPYMNLIRCRLPIICCEQVLNKMMNEDLYNICLADA